MRIKSSEFIISAKKQTQYSSFSYPEISFSGRSNVGKSSLINALINRKKLVKTSSTPGHTRLINFFLINKDIMFVDLPGYGYAKIPIKMKKNWKLMIEDYLKNRKCLRSNVLLIDIRRGPEKEEFEFISWLEVNKIPNILVLTKIDKFPKSKLFPRTKLISDMLKIDESNLILFSAKKKIGKNKLWNAILEKY